MEGKKLTDENRRKDRELKRAKAEEAFRDGDVQNGNEFARRCFEIDSDVST
jgi:hypothetical protein